MLISTFSTLDSTKIKVSLVAKGSQTIGDICISYGPTNTIYLTFDEVIALVNQLDELIGRNLP
jgi:hypothetical protein